MFINYLFNLLKHLINATFLYNYNFKKPDFKNINNKKLKMTSTNTKGNTLCPWLTCDSNNQYNLVIVFIN